MLLYDRRSLLILLAGLPLAGGCGFTPAYGPGGAARDLPGRIRADDPQDRDGFDFLDRFEQRLGRPDGADFRLVYSISVRDQALARTPELRDSRVHLVGRLDYELRRSGVDTLLASGTLNDFTAYSTTSNALANRSAAEDARRRLMYLLADQLVTRLGLTVQDWASPTAPA